MPVRVLRSHELQFGRSSAKKTQDEYNEGDNKKNMDERPQAHHKIAQQPHNDQDNDDCFKHDSCPFQPDVYLDYKTSTTVLIARSTRYSSHMIKAC